MENFICVENGKANCPFPTVSNELCARCLVPELGTEISESIDSIEVTWMPMSGGFDEPIELVMARR